MTEKRFTKCDTKIRDNGEEMTQAEVRDMLNTLHEENQELKQELHKIYKLATVNKVRDIVENVYDDLLYETTDESDYARKNVLKCLEEIDLLSDDLRWEFFKRS